MKEDGGGRRGPPSFAGRPQVYLAATNRKARVHDPTILAKEKVLAKGMERRLATLCIGAVVGVGGATAAAAAAPAIVRRNVD